MSSLKKITLKLSNMSCASCVSHIEKTLKTLKGIDFVSVNFATNTANIKFFENQIKEDEILKTLQKIGYPGKVTRNQMDPMSKQKELFLLRIRAYTCIFFTLPFVFNMLSHFLNWGFHLSGIYQFFLASIVQVFGGWPFYLGSYRSLKSFRSNMDVLIALGTSSAYIYSTFVWVFANANVYYYDTSAMIISLVLIGKMIEKKSTLKAQSGMRALLEMQPKQANVYRGEKLQKIPIEQVQKGDIFAVQAGEKIPVDGEIIEGNSSVDESMLTGESSFIEKKEKDPLFAGTINGNGFLKAKALKVGADTALHHIIELVEKAQNTKAPIQKLVDKVSAIFVPLVLLVSLFTFFIWWLILHNLVEGVISAVAVLIIACPCALGLATPIVIMVATTQGAKHGILIKNAESLEKAKNIHTIVFDKTGTITVGKPKVHTLDAKDKSFALKILYSMAKNSAHPASKALLEFGIENNVSEVSLDQFQEIPGKGIVALFEKKPVLMGSLSFLKESDIDLKEFSKKVEHVDQSILALAVDRECIAVVFLEDPVKEDSKKAIDLLKTIGILTIMLTGDRKEVAASIAKQINIDDFIAQVLPQDKSNYVQKIKDQGHITAMVGDGINDAPALASSDVAFAIAHGTDVAMENADIGLMKNSLLDVVKLIHLSFLSSAKIKQNLFFAFFYNSAAVPLAAIGLLNPVIAAAAMALSSISVIANALLLQKKKL